MSKSGYTIDISIFSDLEMSYPEVQGRYRMHGFDDVLWTDDPRQIVLYVEDELAKVPARLQALDDVRLG